jgi:hypothetical protein
MDLASAKANCMPHRAGAFRGGTFRDSSLAKRAAGNGRPAFNNDA